MSTQSVSAAPAGTATGTNMIADPKPAAETSQAAKPCCVCNDEKAKRDECMLFSNGDPEEQCQTTIQKYKSCMAGYGFKLP